MDNNFENVTFHHRTLCKQLSQSLLLCNIKCSLDIKILFLTLLALCSLDEWTFRVYFEGDSIFFLLERNKTRVCCLHSKIAFAYRNNTRESEGIKNSRCCATKSSRESQTITAAHQYNTFSSTHHFIQCYFLLLFQSYRPRRHCLADCVTHTHHTRSRFS